jgi:hypothetical protein
VAIDAEIKDKLLAHFGKTWRNRACHLCGGARWDLQGHLTFVLSDKPGEQQLIMGGPGLPCVAAICQQCGNTMFFNLVIAGAVQGGAPSPP